MTLEGVKLKKKDGKVPFFHNKVSNGLVFQTNVRV